ncbi:MAG: multicopper oxidase domain-containing protein [Methylococcales bacterium]|nr:multicopper oxidase domain-containing protein [Methylococcales bacterium]
MKKIIIAYKQIRIVISQVQKNKFKLVPKILESVIVASTISASKTNSTLAVGIALVTSSLFVVTQAEAGFNIPTATVNKITGLFTPVPSPLCIAGSCATEFTAKILLFDEFGTKNLSSTNSTVTLPPVLGDCSSMPDGAALDTFLKEDLNSTPSRLANISAANAWEVKIKDCVPGVTSTVAEGRPSGEEFAHQRWDEFPAQKYFQSAQTGARDNGGLRDNRQMHGYKTGEFAKGGLYYIDVDGDGNPGTQGLKIRLHPALPVQDKNSVWTFDGTLPPKLLMAKYGEALIFRHWNALPIDVSANNGFGRHTISTHEHNGHNGAESDGFMHAYSYPGQFYDYHWPMVLAGHDSINVGALSVKTGAPDGNGGITQVPGDWHETMSTHWFHDHMMDYTAQNVYKGNAAMMNYYSAIDRGREPANLAEASGSSDKPGYGCNYADNNPISNPSSFNVNLCLPSGSGLDWGNRDYDVNLVLADKAWDTSGQLKFNIFNLDGFLGDRMTVNWEYKPYMDVRARRYRFRLLNGAVSRNFKVAVVQALTDSKGTITSYKSIPFYMIANDGNLMQHAIPFPIKTQPIDPVTKKPDPTWILSEGLPEQGIAERYDIIVDFAQVPVGGKVYLVNLLEHQNGTGPSSIRKLVDVIGVPAIKGVAATKTSPAIAAVPAVTVDGLTTNATYVADGISGDPVVGKFLEFRVQTYSGTDLSMNPVDYMETVTVAGKQVPGRQMIPVNKPTPAELKAAVQRTFAFGQSNGTDTTPWTVKTDDISGGGLAADEHRVSAAPELPILPNDLGKVEIWHIQGAGGWTHPVHVHFEEGQILKRGGVAPPIWEKYARKDVYRVGPMLDSTTSIDMAIRFREFAGTYMEHCHNTQHEDHSMLVRWDIERPGQTLRMPVPMPDWNGTTYDQSISLPTVKFGDLSAKKSFKFP